MNFECIIYEKKEAIVIIQLNRPKVLNAMNKQLWIDLQAGLDQVENDDEVKVLIITGAGRAFSSGADLKDSANRPADEYRGYLTELQEASRRILRFDKPTIAAINGYALGSGYELGLACDIRIAAETALIGSPEARVSSSVTGGAMRLIQNLIGPARAKELLFTAENIDGKQAAAIGLVNHAVPLENLMDEALILARKIAVNSAFSIKMIKRGLHLAQGEMSMEALMDFEIEACLACVNTETRRKALDNFETRERT